MGLDLVFSRKKVVDLGKWLKETWLKFIPWVSSSFLNREIYPSWKESNFRKQIIGIHFV
jgi:hypothetical protein